LGPVSQRKSGARGNKGHKAGRAGGDGVGGHTVSEIRGYRLLKREILTDLNSSPKLDGSQIAVGTNHGVGA